MLHMHPYSGHITPLHYTIGSERFQIGFQLRSARAFESQLCVVSLLSFRHFYMATGTVRNLSRVMDEAIGRGWKGREDGRVDGGWCGSKRGALQD